MGKMKEMAQYLVKTCPLWEDLHGLEMKEAEEAFQTEGLSLQLQFSHVEIVDGVPNWVYPCAACNDTHFIPMHEGDYEYIGQTPSEEEDCCRKYTSYQTTMALRLQMRNTYGKEPEGARLAIKSEHGEYYELVCHWDPQHPLSYAYAMFMTDNLPTHWSPAAKAYLKTVTGEN